MNFSGALKIRDKLKKLGATVKIDSMWNLTGLNFSEPKYRTARWHLHDDFSRDPPV
jgi:hypothetical protein